MDAEEKKKINEALSPIHLEAGRGLMECQRFEYYIGLMLYFLSLHDLISLENTRATAIMENEEKKTAGQLIGLLKNQVSVSPELEEKLALGLAARNSLAHRVLIDNIEMAMSPEGREELVSKIRLLRKEISKASKALEPFVDALTKASGIDPKRLAEEARRDFRSHT